MCTEAAKIRLEYLRSQIEAECISYGEISELQGLAEYIEPDDMQLREWAGIPETVQMAIMLGRLRTGPQAQPGGDR
jgi:hypothetical protein